MDQGRAELEKQQRMMLRTIGDIQKMAYKAMKTNMNADFEVLERADLDFGLWESECKRLTSQASFP